MLTILTGTDWVALSDSVMERIRSDVHYKQGRRILMVPELISHDTERRLCEVAGDTCSRFAEVLTFSRLVKRVCQWCGCGAEECLDNGGRLVAMASAARQLHSKLKAYAAVETRPEFLSNLVETVDEFKRCCITPQDLLRASKETEGAFSQKLEELSLLQEAYDAICAQGKRDPRDQMNWLLEELENCDFAREHVFYIDGFPDFTRQHMAVLEHLIQNAADVVVTVNTDGLNTANPAFEKAAQTMAQLLQIAKNHGIRVKIDPVGSLVSKLKPISEHLFRGNIEKISLPQTALKMSCGDGIQHECIAAADEVLALLHSGARYREIGIVCSDPVSYGNTILSYLDRCGIPAYMAGTEDVLDKSVISTVLHGMDAAIEGFSTREVMRYFRSVASPASLKLCDAIENYTYIWGIQGNQWLSEWTMHPRGLQDQWTAADEENLRELNAARAVLMEPLRCLREGFANAVKLSDRTDAIYNFIEQIGLNQRLEEMAHLFDERSDNRNAQILSQLWEILLSALEQLESVLGNTAWDNDSFARLFKLLLSQYDVGTIPPVLDAVTVGTASAMRCQRVKHLLVLGANEGAFPKYGSTLGVLTDQERKTLRKLGVPLTGGAAEGLQIEFSEIYGVFCGAENSIYASCLADQPSFVWKRLLQMSEAQYFPKNILGSAAANAEEAAAFLLQKNAAELAKDLDLTAACREIEAKRTHALGMVSRENIEKLYGKKLNLSASQIDKQADCRFAYFLKYGVRAQPRKPAEVDPAEFGTYVHAVLENTAREVCDLGGFHSVELEQTLQIAQKYSDTYIRERFSQIDSVRLSHLFTRNTAELMMLVEELWCELQQALFAPVGFEVAFGDGQQLPAIPIPGKEMDAQLRGFVDRVDSWNDGVRNFFRVVDYKTGQKSFDYCDVFNGLGLQMLLYLFALAQEGAKLLGEKPVPAGVQYFPARVPVLSSDGELTDEEVDAARKTHWKRKGLLLHDEMVLNAMDPADPPERLCCKKKKDGTYSGDLADTNQLEKLNKYVFRLLGKMVDEIASGNVEPNPYSRGSSHNACRFCDYALVCHATSVEGRRNYKAMTAQRFWEEIDKEMSSHG